MKRRNLRANETLFAANDLADELYYVVDGELFIPEVQQTVGPGSFVGEMALFSNTGRRTATAIARTDCTVMLLGKKAVFAALLHSPQLGVHLLKVITVRMLENAGVRDQVLVPANDAVVAARTPDKLLDRFGRKSRIAVLAVLGVIPVVLAIYQPLYIVLDRDAAVTSWLNEATAPISGTIERFESRIGQKVDETGLVATLVDRSVDRSGVIRAEGQERRAETRLAQIEQYRDRVTRLGREWSERRARYADGFRRDLDLEIQDLEQRLTLLKERVALADASARRRRSLRVSGTASQADEDVATSSHRELQVSLTQMEKALERVRERRRLAEQGVFLQQDGKEPEWSWRSIDEIDLEAARANRAVSDAQEDLNTARSLLAEERKNLSDISTASIRVPPSRTIWSSRISNNSAVKQGDRLFSWIDCSVLLVDVPVTETLAALLQEGMRATVLLDGDPNSYQATVLQTRGASSRIGRSELASISRGHKSWTAQALVSIEGGQSVSNCPIGRRAFVTFPDIRLI